MLYMKVMQQALNQMPAKALQTTTATSSNMHETSYRIFDGTCEYVKRYE